MSEQRSNMKTFIKNLCDIYMTTVSIGIPDSKVHGANMGPTWGQQDPGGPHVGHVNLAIWDILIHKLQLIFINHAFNSTIG